MHIHAWCHDKSTMHPCYVLRELRFIMVWNIHVLCNLPYTMHGIVRHGVAMYVTVTQGTCLDKYLTTPYCKNATKQFSYPQQINMFSMSMHQAVYVCK